MQVVGSSAARRGLQLVFILLITIGPYVWNSFYFYCHGHSIFEPRGDAGLALSILFEIASLLLVSITLWSRTAKWRDLGLRWSVREVVFIGPLLALGAYCAYWVSYHAAVAIHNAVWPEVPFTTEPTIWYGHPGLLLILFNLVNPFCEELIVRVFLMTEILELTGSWILAAVLSAVIQASYHIYYGMIVALALCFQFLVFSLFYARWRRATPLIVAHGVFDLYLPILGLLFPLIVRFLY